MTSASAGPAISVVMPTFDKAPYLELTLASYVGQSLRDYELVVVDDGSTDDTAAVVRRYAERLPITAVRQDNKGRSAARNAGIRAAAGEVVVFSDDDRIVSPDFVAEHAKAFAAGGALLVQGGQRGVLTRWHPELRADERLTALDLELPGSPGSPDLPDREVALVDAHAVETDLDQVLATYGVPEPWWEQHVQRVLEAFPDPADFALSWMIGTTGNMSALREQIVEVGLLDEGFTRWGLEDTDLCYRLVHAGARVVVAPDAVNHHQVHPSTGSKASEWLTNFRHFSRKVDTVEPALFRLLAQGLIDVRTADAVARECAELSRAGRTVLVDELRRRYDDLFRLFEQSMAG
ncbi:glycosyltransferase family 2 protein [Saccharothrix variisporea]|uniref:Galactosyltransferase-like protein n=1 Tax=Saccharothrix variisporea TaxID=543527 RepID=A0A495X6G9_9PSEU|nr:glycosyltransferase family 2 protein [Saccharothrix variisporea]RKT69129.1 galactosyltransferase-like protein [Saccharothrix variisporea]